MITHELVKTHFANTILELAKTRDITKLTVKELVAAAGTARQTFYNHFDDMNDLICYVAILPFFSGELPVFSFENQLASVQFAYDRPEFFSQLAKHTGRNSYRETFARQLRKVLGDIYLDEALDPEERRYREAAICLYCEGAVAMFIEWLGSGMEASVATIATALANGAPEFIRHSRPCDLYLRVDEIDA